MTIKRTLDMDVSELKEVANATIHGAIRTVSPIKTSKKNEELKYFEVSLTDGRKVTRMVPF